MESSRKKITASDHGKQLNQRIAGGIHCQAVQGFHLNVPLIADEFATVLKQGILPHNLNLQDIEQVVEPII
jgi:hypothetical protein